MNRQKTQPTSFRAPIFKEKQEAQIGEIPNIGLVGWPI